VGLRAFNLGGLRFLLDAKELPAMDPVTAINNGIAALFQFLATPQGQLIVADIRAVNSKIGTQLGDLIGHIHDQLPPAPPKAA